MNFTHDVTLADIELYPLSATGGVSPNMALGQMPVRPALLIKLIDNNGCFGWGEIWSNFPPRANIHKANLIDDVVSQHMIGARFSTPVELTAMLRHKLSVYFLHIGQQQVFEHILAGIDTAAWDLCLRNNDMSFAAHMGIKAQAHCYASSLNPGDLAKRLDDHAGMGQTEFKLKIGFEAHADYAFVSDAAACLPANAHLMIDSNQSWDLACAKETLKRLEPFSLLFAEEAIRADCRPQEWEELAASTTIPLAAGENLYGVDHFIEMGNAGVTYLQPDVAKWGGVTGALELANSLPAGCKLWPHFMGSAIGQQASLAISAAMGGASKCEMDVNENALRTSLSAASLAVKDGCVALSQDAGLVTPPLPETLLKFAPAV